ncbi:hypothetical protein [Nocardia sp. CA-290969]|uniref:RNA polymerase factor sigma-54 n=1 Tax=Nocardia sp. CA-290969 TaxID=3239986 RepID=UPI003D941C32
MDTRGGSTTPRRQLRIASELRQVPGLLHTLALLPLTDAEVETVVERALAENPMLEREPGSVCPGCGRWRRDDRCARCMCIPLAPPDVASRPIDEVTTLALCEVRPDCRPVMVLVLDHLTDRGLLDSEPAEIAALHGVPLGHVTECLRALRAAGPPGIGERDMASLLAAQARVLVASGSAEHWVVDLVHRHLDLIATRDSHRVAELYSVSPGAAARAFDLVAERLRPYADAGQVDGTDVRVPPDIMVERTGSGALEVRVHDSHWFGLRVRGIDRELAVDTRAVAWLRDYRRAAHEMLRRLDCRASALERIARAAVEHQEGFLAGGPTAHRPLTRAAVAAAVGVHESTVSRAVWGKKLRLPDRSIIDFADLFGTAVAVRAELAALCRDTSLGDRGLCEELRARGFAVSRRTVAKYRAQLGLAPGYLRG